MTLLNWSLSPESVFVMTDTACRMDGSRGIATSSTKVHPHPRLEMILAATGCHLLAERWNDYVGVWAAASEDVDDLDAEAVQVLPVLWGNALSRGAAGTATIYHWGWSARDEAFVGYAYRSTEGFRSDRLPAGSYIKPEPFDLEAFRDSETGEYLAPDSIESFIRIAAVQKSSDRAGMRAAPLERARFDGSEIVGGVGIGGHLVGHWLLQDAQGRSLHQRRLHTFPDHVTDRANMTALGRSGPGYVIPHLKSDHLAQMIGESFVEHRRARRWFKPSTWRWTAPPALMETLND